MPRSNARGSLYGNETSRINVNGSYINIHTKCIWTIRYQYLHSRVRLLEGTPYIGVLISLDISYSTPTSSI